MMHPALDAGNPESSEKPRPASHEPFVPSGALELRRSLEAGARLARAPKCSRSLENVFDRQSNPEVDLPRIRF